MKSIRRYNDIVYKIANLYSVFPWHCFSFKSARVISLSDNFLPSLSPAAKSFTHFIGVYIARLLISRSHTGEATARTLAFQCRDLSFKSSTSYQIWKPNGYGGGFAIQGSWVRVSLLARIFHFVILRLRSWMPMTQRTCIYGSLTLDVDRHYIESVTATTHQQKRHNNTCVEPHMGNCTMVQQHFYLVLLL